MKVTPMLKAALASAVVAFVCSTATANVLTNPSFEVPDASGGDVPGATGWFQFNDAFTSAAFPAQDGDQVLKIFGPFNAGGGAGVGQGGFAAAAGQSWVASAFARNPAVDAIGAGNFAVVQLQFQDSGGNTLLNVDSAPINTASPQDLWIPLAATGIAPVGTASAQIVLVHVQGEPITGGSVLFDTASLDVAPIPEPASLGVAAIGGLALLRRRRSI